MFDVYISNMEFEKCDRSKRKIEILVPYTVFHYILEGEGYFNGHKLRSGQFFSANKNDWMCYYPDTENPWTYIWVRLYGSDCASAMDACGLADDVHFGDFENMEGVRELLKLYGKIDSQHHHNKTLAKTAANMLMLLHMPPKPVSDKSDSLREFHVQQIKEYMDENYYKKLTVADIAGKFFLSRAYIRNIFAKYLGISPKQYLQKIRMERAAELLAETDTSISLIAHSVGYDDPLLFSKIFSGYYKVSPTVYRKDYGFTHHK